MVLQVVSHYDARIVMGRLIAERYEASELNSMYSSNKDRIFTCSSQCGAWQSRADRDGIRACG